MYNVTKLLLSVLCALATLPSFLFAQTIVYDGNYATIAGVNVNLGDDCSFDLRASNVLTGATSGDPLPPDSLFIVVVEDDDEANGGLIDGCGDFDFTVVPKENSGITNFTFGRGTVRARKTSPPVPLFTAEANEGLSTTELADLSLNNLPGTVPRTFEVSSETSFPIPGTFQMALMVRLMRGGDIPRFRDGCGNVLVTVSDQVLLAGPCDSIVIRRTFMARSANAVCNMDVPMTDPDSGVEFITYDIVLERPSIQKVMDPPGLVQIDCNDPDLIIGTIPKPRPEDYPSIRSGDSTFFLTDPFGNVGASFSDSEPIQTCANTFKVVRTYTVIDWCRPDSVVVFPQVVKVGDAQPPAITPPVGDLVFSTNTPGCGALINTDLAGLAVDDACSGVTSLEAFVLVNGDTTELLGPIMVRAPRPIDRLTPFVPLGKHILRYVATDECQNQSSVEVEFTVEDRSGPVVIVEDALNVSISDAGFAVVEAVDLDKGSYDDCSEVTLEIAFANPNTLLATGPFGPFITLTCVDVGAVPVVIRVTDANGNANTRMSILNVADNAAPVCVAPASLVLSCNQVANQLPEDVNAFFEADPVGTTRTFDDLFGAPTTLDNCPGEDVQQTIVSTVNDCGTGTITRTFTVTDGRGFVSVPGCQQVITVQGTRDYIIEFPGDASTNCGEGDHYDELTIKENSCDLVLVNTSVDTFRSDGPACHKLRITYDVINWCEYDGFAPFYEVDRDADGDLITTEPTFLHIDPNDDLDPANDQAYYDRDDNRNNNNTIGSLDVDYGTSASRGAFRYRQFVKVYDDSAPEITEVATNITGSENCTGGNAAVSFTLSDGCSTGSLNLQVELDVDYDTGTGFFPSGPAPQTNNNGNGNYTLSIEQLPVGEHAIRLRVNDGCGNVAGQIIRFTVEDASLLSPICVSQLTFVLINDGNGGGIAAVEADDYVRGANGNCNNVSVNYSIYREEGEAGAPGFVPAVGRTEFLVSCDDRGEIPIRVYALNDNGQGDFCSTTAVIEPITEELCDDGGLGSLAGFIVSPQNDLLSDIEVHITDRATMADMMYTDDNGSFLFTDLAVGNEYTIRPAMSDRVDLRRVKTSDIIKITQHILHLEVIDDPYRMIAADVNADGQIDIGDMVAIRRIILGMDDTYIDGPTWRFLRRDFDLAGLKEGWDPQAFPNTFTVPELGGHNREADFIAIEIGDVFTEGSGRSTGALVTEDQLLQTGETATIYIGAENLRGFQGTVAAESGLELIDWSSDRLGSNNVNDRYLNEGLLALSYYAPKALSGDFLHLTVRATHDLRLSDYLYLTDRIAMSEGYDATGRTTDLNFAFETEAGKAAILLHQNFPNPATEQTTITFDLVRSETVSILVHDLQGRLLYRRELLAHPGRNQLRLSAQDLNNSTGVLTYSLVADGERLTRRMTIVAP